ncbi:MAG TPA: 50S ribosomal protein L17 [Firmicutes bacterium]|jgi:large subunit ribosomal protein L17|nr:50S ribosomal protein L17 [Bacillota bacterium]
MILRRLGRNAGHRKALFRNLVTDLFRYERIKTTEVKAEEVRILAENLITLAKKGDLSARRQAAAIINNNEVVKKLFNEIAGKYSDRNGGYTRILKIGPRRGDAASMVILELV